ncbi:MAG: type II toxin-antitoxin system HicA family toxin [archaeon]|nr:type II toxin-antitoxin system HicA family toxin [archaeon]
MARLPRVSGKEMCKLLEKIGFKRVHQVGSHIRYVHGDGRRTVVAVHGNEELGIGVFKEILNQAGLSRRDYEKLRKKL